MKKKNILITAEIIVLLAISPLLFLPVLKFCEFLLRLFKAEFGPYIWFGIASILLPVSWFYLIAKTSFLRNWYFKILLSYVILYVSLSMLFIIWFFCFVPVG